MSAPLCFVSFQNENLVATQQNVVDGVLQEKVSLLLLNNDLSPIVKNCIVIIDMWPSIPVTLARALTPPPPPIPEDSWVCYHV